MFGSFIFYKWLFYTKIWAGALSGNFRGHDYKCKKKKKKNSGLNNVAKS